MLQIFFYAERGNGIFSDIAIDQFEVRNGRCAGDRYLNLVCFCPFFL